MYDDGFNDIYCYPNTNVLRNRLNLTNPIELEVAENTIVGSKMLANLPLGDLNPAHLKALHKHLFGEIYDWAGDFRTIRISKNKSHFCFPEHIEQTLIALFDKSVLLNSDGLNYDDIIKQSATFLAELNAIHPFREGNGRTQMVFMQMILGTYGLKVDFSATNKNAFINAIVQSFKHDNSLLELELRKVIFGV